jgi:hypothetical protein
VDMLLQMKRGEVTEKRGATVHHPRWFPSPRRPGYNRDGGGHARSQVSSRVPCRCHRPRYCDLRTPTPTGLPSPTLDVSTRDARSSLAGCCSTALGAVGIPSDSLYLFTVSK